MNKKICIVYTHHKLGDLIWQLPYIKAISDHHGEKIDLILRKKTQAKNILKDLKHINKIYYNEFRKGLFYWIELLTQNKQKVNVLPGVGWERTVWKGNNLFQTS